MANKTQKSITVKSIIVAVFFVVLVLSYFNHLSNKSATRRSDAQKTEIQTLMDYDMEMEYPNTPRDVAKLHNRYFKLFYGQSLSDEELSSLNKKVRMLYCHDLLVANPEADSLLKLKNDIEAVKEAGYTYKLCELPEASQVETFTKDGSEMASLEVRITVNTKETMGYIYRQYLMVKEDGCWKIYGWGESQMSNESLGATQ